MKPGMKVKSPMQKFSVLESLGVHHPSRQLHKHGQEASWAWLLFKGIFLQTEPKPFSPRVYKTLGFGVILGLYLDLPGNKNFRRCLKLMKIQSLLWKNAFFKKKDRFGFAQKQQAPANGK